MKDITMIILLVFMTIMAFVLRFNNSKLENEVITLKKEMSSRKAIIGRMYTLEDKVDNHDIRVTKAKKELRALLNDVKNIQGE